jgi:hypothetical protein
MHRTWSPRLGLVGLLAAACGIGAAEDNPRKPETEPQALLRAVSRRYGALLGIHLKSRTEIPIQEKDRRLLGLTQWRDNHVVGPQQAGTWSCEHEFRLTRGAWYRIRAAEVGCRGECLTGSTTGNTMTQYFGGFGSPEPQRGSADFTGVTFPYPLKPTGRIWFADGTVSFGLSRGFGTGTHMSPNLPVRLFLKPRNEVLFANEGIEVLQAPEGTGEWVLRLKMPRTVVRDIPKQPRSHPIREKWKFLGGTWNLWIDGGELAIRRLDVREDWKSLVEPGRTALFELRESYPEQVLNPPFTPDDFRVEPPEPVSPAPQIQPLAEETPAADPPEGETGPPPGPDTVP